MWAGNGCVAWVVSKGLALAWWAGGGIGLNIFKNTIIFRIYRLNGIFVNNYPVVKAVAGTCGDGK